MMHGHIVVAEDDEATADLLRACLTQAGYEVTVVTDGQAALEAVTTDRPDLILLDERMASRAGHEVARRLKASEETRFIPLVILTSGSGSEDKERLLEVGADDLITKPFHSTELLIRVRSLLRLGRLHQDLMDNNRELQAAYETARESEAKYRALIQDAQDALLLVDPSSATILEANRRARELSGYDEDDLIGQTASMLCSEGAAGNCQALIARVMTEGRAIAEGDGTLRCKGGEDIPIEIHASLANHHLGKPLIQALIRDLRPRRQLESERNKSERLAAVVETAVTVNHEINNPLFVIISSVESLQRTLFNADSGVRDKLERISEACRRIQRFTQQLSSVIAPVSKEYLPGLKMLDIQQSVAAKPDADAGDTHEPGP
ncbi:MAG: response regulator [Armatimonadetes bacterium]|nr:response regulator [Armatimonadota bacterium]